MRSLFLAAVLISVMTNSSRAENAPSPLSAPFDAKMAKTAQGAWAKHLGKSGPVEKNSIEMSLTLIPAGDFLMGGNEPPEVIADNFQADAFGDEHPQHRVHITKPFYLGTFEVTKGQFAKFVTATGYKTDAEKDGEGGFGYTGNDKDKPFKQDKKFNWREWGVSQSDESPVVNVTWKDVQKFCEWLNAKEDKDYRLPTEAEWEYACRAGTTTPYYCGDDPEELARAGNLRDATTRAKWPVLKDGIQNSDGYAFTAPVGRFKPNAFGLYDMHGNVSEWCADRYDNYGKSEVSDPQGPSKGSARVARGGAWLSPALFCRSASRLGSAATLYDFG